ILARCQFRQRSALFGTSPWLRSPAVARNAFAGGKVRAPAPAPAWSARGPRIEKLRFARLERSNSAPSRSESGANLTSLARSSRDQDLSSQVTIKGCAAQL